MNSNKLPYSVHLVPLNGASIESKSWACGECLRVAQDYDHALNCCKIPLCNRCGKEPRHKYYVICDTCQRKSENERQEAAWDKMPEVPYDGGPVYDGDRYFQNDEDYWEHYYEGDADGRVELCDEKKLGYEVTPDNVLDYLNERMLEDVEDNETAKIEGEAELRVALEKFFDSQTYMLWVTNGKKAILEKPEGKYA